MYKNVPSITHPLILSSILPIFTKTTSHIMHFAHHHNRQAMRQERAARRSEARAINALAHGNIGGFIRNEQRANRHHDRAVRQGLMAHNSRFGRRHHHHHHGGPGFGGATALAAGAVMGAVAAGAYSSNSRVYGAPNTVVSAPPPVVVVQQPQPQVVVQQPQQQSELLSVQCPQTAGPGSTIQITVRGQLMQVQVPQGVAPGTNFTISVPKTMAVPEVQAVPVQQPQLMTATVPAGAFGGSMINVSVNGRAMQVQVPQGLNPGQQFQFSVA